VGPNADNREPARGFPASGGRGVLSTALILLIIILGGSLKATVSATALECAEASLDTRSERKVKEAAQSAAEGCSAKRSDFSGMEQHAPSSASIRTVPASSKMDNSWPTIVMPFRITYVGERSVPWLKAVPNSER
jgi:hypothetical protein